VFAEQATDLTPVLAWGVGERIDHDVGPAVAHDDQAEPEPATQLTNVVDLGGDPADSEVDRVGQAQAVDALQHKSERERGLEFDDHGRFGSAHPDDIATAHLTLDGVALSLEKSLDRPIQVALQWHTRAR